jgi:hypothetical protein
MEILRTLELLLKKDAASLALLVALAALAVVGLALFIILKGGG